MLGENSNTTVGIGVVVSVLLHLITAWVFLAGHASSAEALAFDRPDAPPPPQQKRIDLGDPESRAVSMSWLGSDEYRKHIAQEAEVDQPELTMDPAAPTSSASTPSPAAMVAQARQAAAAAQREAERMIEELAGGLRAIESLSGVLPTGEGARAGREGAEEGTGEASERAVAESPAGQEAPEPTERAETGEATPEQMVSAPSPERNPSEGAQGQQDDRESDATSVAQTELKHLGNPLSARGLRIRTVKPQFSHYTSIMSSPHDPVIRLHFGSDGRVQLVELLQSSGINDIDRPVLDAAYRWRAEGKSLQQLGSSETISIDMRIML